MVRLSLKMPMGKLLTQIFGVLRICLILLMQIVNLQYRQISSIYLQSPRMPKFICTMFGNKYIA